jgi:hypothetical protein
MGNGEGLRAVEVLHDREGRPHTVRARSERGGYKLINIGEWRILRVGERS